MSAPGFMSRDAYTAEVTRLREQLAQLTGTLRTIKRELAPDLPVPVRWRLTVAEDKILSALITKAPQPVSTVILAYAASPQLDEAMCEPARVADVVMTLRGKLRLHAPGCTIDNTGTRGGGFYRVSEDSAAALRVALAAALSGGPEPGRRRAADAQDRGGEA